MMAFGAVRKLLLIIAGAVVLVAAACGSDDAGAPGDGQAGEAAPNPVVAATVRLPGEAGEAISGVAAGKGAVWVALGGCDGSVSRIDLESNEVVATTPVGFVSAIAIGEGAVWALGSVCGPPEEREEVLFRIDPETNELVETIPLGLTHRAAGPGSATTGHLAAGEGGVWVSVAVRVPERGAGEILRIDPATNEIAARIETGRAVFNIAAHRGALWVLTRGGKERGSTLLRIDPDTDQVRARLAQGRLAVAGGSLMPPIMAAGEGQLWIWGFGGRDRVSREAFRVDVETNEVTREGLDTERFFPFAVVEGGIWSLRAGRVPVVERFNLRTLEIDARAE